MEMSIRPTDEDRRRAIYEIAREVQRLAHAPQPWRWVTRVALDHFWAQRPLPPHSADRVHSVAARRHEGGANRHLVYALPLGPLVRELEHDLTPERLDQVLRRVHGVVVTKEEARRLRTRAG